MDADRDSAPSGAANPEAPAERPPRRLRLRWRALIVSVAAVPTLAIGQTALPQQPDRRPAASKAQLQGLQPRDASAAATKAQPEDAGDAAAVGGVVVMLHEPLDEPRARALLAALGATPLRPLGPRGWLVDADAAAADALARMLQASPQVEHAHPNRWQRRALK
ncbi:MAG TPA: hypothetical protein VM491_04795 [Burkholderiaceae bacterium]|nr:hypothetical protein [Burkholderiaceae bacterium]